jgi:ribosomal-protein-alanine N-acetyltransferase
MKAPATARTAYQTYIREARAADLEAIHAIEVASFSDPWKREGFRDLILGGNATVVVAEADGVVVGFAVSYAAADEAEIANVAVTDVARRRGVGRTLVDWVIAGAVRGGARAVFLEVRDANVAARALYAVLGFAEVARRRGYYRNPVEDAIVMRLDVPNALA